MATTRRLLERVPGGQGQWKPHLKSFSLGHLAQLVSWMPGWITNTLQHTELNLAGAVVNHATRLQQREAMAVTRRIISRTRCT